ncbi:hypothetical protein C8J57DRAFT_1558865 [Mycena rebaudengoi]|nr:hypothetical protein C8J57DRAFT_1558865 [Mycena rebaudengoi]
MTKKKKAPGGTEFNLDSTLPCPQCNAVVKVGTGGYANLTEHQKSKECKDNDPALLKLKKITTFFKKKPPAPPSAPLIPSTVSAPQPLNAAGPSSFPSTMGRSDSPDPALARSTSPASFSEPNNSPFIPVIADETQSAFRTTGHQVFANLRQLMETIPRTVPLATEAHPLYAFSGDPLEYFGTTLLPEDWEHILLSKIVAVFRKGPLSEIPCRGHMGLDGFCDFLEHFNCSRAFAENSSRYFAATGRYNCIQVTFPAGKNEHTSYPFALHVAHDLPWGYRSINNAFFVQAHACDKTYPHSDNTECRKCRALGSNVRFAGILNRITNGVHENTPLAYQPIEQLVEIVKIRGEQAVGLRLMRLNDSKRLFRIMAALDNYKELIMAIASGRICCVSNILASGLRNHAGVMGLALLCYRAVKHQFKAANDMAEKAVGLLFLRLGGQRLAEIAHHALGLPSVSTLRRNTVIRPLLPSSGRPTVQEIEANIDACFEAGPDFSNGATVLHVVLMLDEIATEHRLRYDDRNNKVVGVCRAHSHLVPLEIQTQTDLEILREGIRDGRAHLTGETTVAGIGPLDRDPCKYSVRPILFSPDCKNEDGPEHAVNVLRPLMTAIRNKAGRTMRVLCASSDGESRRGHAFAMEYMNRPLSEESPIFPQLCGLELMNFRVGEDDMTPDKDFKHALKCLRGLLMRDAGIEIHGFTITVAILREHLVSHGISITTINGYLNSKDRQHVIKSVSLLRAIWNLPDAPDSSTPIFVRARQALQIFGKLAYNILMPYICIDLDLDEQLVHLSTAAHMLLDLYVENNTRTRFMPVQTFVNLMIMIKNIFFCVAKTKVDIPEGNFWIILLGTDRLEIFFGLVRTAVGTDCNMDALQLASRGTNLTEIAVILAEHPEWDCTPRRIRLTAVGEGCMELDSDVDHLNPASWKGNTLVARVTLLTCWILGRLIAEGILAGSRERFIAMVESKNIDILSPFGTLLLQQYDEEDVAEAYSCARLDADLAALESATSSTTLAESAADLESDASESESDAPESPAAVIESPESSYAGDGDLEDAMAAEESRGGFETHIEINGQKMTKSKALRLTMADLIGPRASTDRTRRVASIAAHGQAAGLSGAEEHILGGPCLRAGSPMCTLVRCEGRLFLAIGSVNGLALGLETLDELSVDLISDATTTISFQILCVVRATEDDDPSNRHDWTWSLNMEGRTLKAQGPLVHALNPELSTSTPGRPTYLFESSQLMALAASLHDSVLPQMRRNIPNIERSAYFPYRNEGQACFLCEDDVNERMIEPEGEAACTLCKPAVALDFRHGQRVLEHCAAHLLHDPSLVRAHQRCGLCLRPSPQCIFYLRKGTPAIWKYNLAEHFRAVHNLVAPASWPAECTIGGSQTTALLKIWKKRNKIPQPRQTGKSREHLEISEQHSSRLAFRLEVEQQLADVISSIPDVQAVTNSPIVDASTDLAPLEESDSELESGLLIPQLRSKTRLLTEDLNDKSDSDTLHVDVTESRPTPMDAVPWISTPPPNISDLADSTFEQEVDLGTSMDHDSTPVQLADPAPALGRTRGRTRTAVAYYECEGCGDEVTEKEQNDDSLSVECAKIGCETRWASVFYLKTIYN